MKQCAYVWGMMRCYLEHHDEKSAKLWEGSVEDNSLTIRWGEIGTKGQSKVKEFDSDEKANAQLHWLLSKKNKEGIYDSGVGVASDERGLK